MRLRISKVSVCNINGYKKKLVLDLRTGDLLSGYMMTMRSIRLWVDYLNKIYKYYFLLHGTGLDHYSKDRVSWMHGHI